MRYILVYICLFIAAIAPSAIFAEGNYTMRQISVHNGLSNIRVNDILLDDDGSMWLATHNGLDRVVEGIVVRNDYEGLDSGMVQHVFKDRDGLIWVIALGRVYSYDRERDVFDLHESPSEERFVTQYCLLDRGVIFVHDYTLFLYRYDTQAIEVLVRSEDPTMMYLSAVATPDGDGLIILGGDRVEKKALYSYRMSTRRLDRYEGVDIEGAHINQNIHLDALNRVWISIYNEGLSLFSIEGEGELIRTFNRKNSEISGDIIQHINEANGQLWVAPEGGAINLIDIENYRVSDLSDLYGHQLNLFAHSVVSSNIKDTDDCYLSTMRQGLINIRRSPIKSVSRDMNNFSPSEKAELITFIAIHEDSQGNIWMGSGSKGLALYDPFSMTASMVAGSEDLRISYIEELDRDNLLIVANHVGLFRFDKRDQEFTKIEHDDNLFKQPSLSFDAPIDVLRLSDEEILITANHLMLYNQTNNSVRIVNDSFDTLYFKCVCIEGREIILFDRNRIVAINIDDGTHREIYAFGTFIQSVTKVGDRLWFIYRNEIRSLSLDGDDLQIYINNSESDYWTLKADKKGDIWLSSYLNLTVFSTTSKTFKAIYEEHDGYVSDHYINKSSTRVSSGEIYMAGNNGYLIVDTNYKYAPTPEREISLFQATLNGEAINTIGVDEIVVPWDFSMLDLRFALRDGDPLSRNRYRYQLRGSRSSSTMYRQNKLSLSMLSPGDYSIDVSYMKRNGEWSDSSYRLAIRVTLPWWRSWWFYLSMVMFVAMLTILFVFMYVRNNRLDLIRLQKEQEQQLFSDKVRFLINVSHELRTSLTLIYAPLKRIIERIDLSFTLKEELSRIMSQSRQTINLLNMTLNLRKMESGQEEIDIQSHNLSEWLVDVAEEFRAELTIRGVDLQYQIGRGCQTLNFDKSMCRIVLSNLLMNGCKYGANRGVLLVKSEKISEKVRISVVDQGVGLKGVDISSLFDRFVQHHNKASGVGVGLSYSKMLVELHPGGVIGAYANPDCGSTFYFEIPLGLECKQIPCESQQYINQMIPSAIDTEYEDADLDYPLNDHTVLVVEDRAELLEFMCDTLKPLFRSVYLAKDGAKGFDLALKHLPDIIISDIMMPKMSGYELCSLVKSDIRVSHIPIVLMTAKNEKDSRRIGYKLGADSYLAKPFDVDELRSILRNQLYSRDMVKRRYSSINIGDMIESNVTFSNVDEQFLLKLNGFISDNISSTDLSANILADHMCMGRTAFYDKVKALTDIGVMEYVGRYKMSIAAERLNSSSATIYQIAESLGYYDGKYFSKIFKNHFKVTPSEYRRSMKTRG